MLAKLTYLFLSLSLLPAQVTYNLYSPEIELPQIGSNESMHFGFWLHADIPDSDGDGDGGLEDYYSISILDMSANAWHNSDFNSNAIGGDENNFWAGDIDVNGYLDGWLQYLDTPPVTIVSGGEFSAKIFYAIESAAGAAGEVEESCTDGWDAANIRISKDGGVTWALLEDSTYPYHFDCGYGWIFNDKEYESGGALNHLAKGWSGESGSWLDFSADLNDYENEEIIIRFAFGSDPAWSTVDDNTLTGFQVDNVLIADDSGEIFSDFGDDMSQMIAGGEVWADQFYDYGSIEDGRPGASGWGVYSSGMPFNGNFLMDISEYAEKSIKFRFQSRYDENHDGGQGNGLFIDDFKIYKISTAIYPPPEGLSFELGSGEVTLTWTDMNTSGTDDFVFHNGYFSEDGAVSLTEEGSAWTGEEFPFIGPSTVHTIKVISINAGPVEVTIGGFESSGEIFKSQPSYSLDVTLEPGENTFEVNGWDMNNSFILGYSFSDVVIAGLDASFTSNNSWVLFSNSWIKWSDIVDANEELNHGDWGISAIITFSGAGVTYNVYRDDENISAGLLENSYTDLNVENNITYEYAVSAIYADGEESEKSDPVSATPISNTVYEESYDDGSYESEFNAGSGNFSAVKYSANSQGESIFRFKWYQVGNGGAFYIKIFEDNGGVPGAEIHSTLQASGNINGWNEKDLSSEGLNVSGDFWIGIKEFSSSKPFGLDENSNAGKSFKRTGDAGDWVSVEGNLMYRVFLDCDDNCDEGAGRVLAQAEDEMEHYFQVPIYQITMKDKTPRLVPVIINGNPLYRKQKITNDLERSYPVDGDEIILFEYDFENSEANDWTNDNGWILTEIESNSPTHSFNSPNDDIDGLEVENGLFPIKFGINQIYPNPFNPAANIQFEISEISQVELSIYNLNGRLVSTLVNAFVNPGMYTSVWNGVDSFGNPVSSGIYFAVLESNKKLIQTQKLVLLK